MAFDVVVHFIDGTDRTFPKIEKMFEGTNGHTSLFIAGKYDTTAIRLGYVIPPHNVKWIEPTQ